jgi:hypothetical protein
MNAKRSTALAAAIAVIAAFTIISAAVFSGTLLTTSSSGPPSNSTQVSTQSSSSQQTSSQVSESTQSSQSTEHTTSQSQTGPGTLAVLLTDPPTVPDGVAKVYVSYTDLAVHASGAGNETGWTTVKASGSIELMGAVNVSQTISSVKITAGSYNLIRFNITSAEVTYYGVNYTAFVQTAELTIPIVGGISVVSSAPSATLIDISPTVVNIGSQSDPEFIIRPVAAAYPVPSSAVTTQTQTPGTQVSLNGSSWWQAIAQESAAKLSIGTASLNSTYLGLKVSNTGGNSTRLNLVIITSVPDAAVANHDGVLPTAVGQAAIFVVLANGTMVQIQAFTQATVTSASTVSASLFGQQGLLLQSGGTASLSYHGSIILGFMGAAIKTPVGGIVKGQQYLVTVIGTQTSASVVVTAS